MQNAHMAQPMTPSNIPTWSIADRIRKAREHAGLDQTELADRTNIARSTISNYERGTTRPSKVYVKTIALATGVDPEWIWSGNGPSDVGEPPTKWYARHLQAA